MKARNKFLSFVLAFTFIYILNPFCICAASEANKFDDELSFVAIIKNEAPYIEEWIEFHKLVGVSKFYIYDNESEDNLKDVLKKYIDSGEVVYKYYPGKCKQNAAYTEAVNDYKNKTRYMGFIDIDEFVIPTQADNLVKVIDDVLSKDKNAAGLAINWRVYGSSGFKEKPKGLVTENYRNRGEDAWRINIHVKTICNPRLVSHFCNPHFAIYKSPYYAVNENGKKVDQWHNDENTCKKVRINHYFSKSFNEFVAKRNRGRADILQMRGMEEFAQHDKNDVYDYIMEPYVNKLKQKLKVR